MHVARRPSIGAHTFPADDAVFAERVREVLGEVATRDLHETVSALLARLAPVHPSVAATIRSEMAGFGGPVVYVYRDGSAVPTPREDDWIDDPSTARVVTDPGGTYVEANEAASVLFGVTRAAIVGRAAGTFTKPDARVRDGDALWRALATTGRLHSRAIVRRPDGGEVAVEFLTLREADGRGRSVTYLRQTPDPTSARDGQRETARDRPGTEDGPRG
jgi:PAS domain S-box-containing protein